MRILEPVEIFTLMKNKIKPQHKAAFLGTFCLGLLTHMMIITSDIPNHDGLSSMYFDQNMIGSGRWFLTIVCGISSYYTLPWLIGVLSLLYLSVTAVVLVELLEIKKPMNAVFVGGLLVTFPALTSTFAYMFTADGYMLALLLACLAVLLTKNYKKGFIAGGILLALSMGSYQAYLSFAIILCIYQVIRICLMEDVVKNKVTKVLSYGVMGIIGAGLYILLQIVLQTIQKVTLNDYQGINEATEGIPTGIIDKLSRIYYDFGAFTLSGNVLTNNIFSKTAFLLLMISVLLIGIKLILNKKLNKNIWFYLISTAIIVTIPVFYNVILIISPNVTYHLLMRYQWILFGILSIAFVEEFNVVDMQSVRLQRDKTFQAIISWVVLITTVIMIFNYAVTDNIAYFNMEKKYEKTYAYCLRLVDRMEQTEGYYQGIPVAMIGVVSTTEFPDTELSFDVTSNIIGANGSIICYTGVNYQAFLKNYLNVTIELAAPETIDNLYIAGIYQELDSFPGENSMKVIDGILVIKTENMQ